MAADIPPSVDLQTRKDRRLGLVRRPALLVVVAIAAASGFAGIGLGLVQRADRHEDRAAAVWLDGSQDAIAEALAVAPWIASDATQPGTVWAIAPTACVGCEAFHRETVAWLAARGGVRVIAVPPATAEAGANMMVAAGLAKGRDWGVYRAFVAGDLKPVAAAAPTDPLEAEGFALWPQAAVQRLAGFGVPIDRPAVVWQEDGRWRMLSAEANGLAPSALDRAGIWP